MGLLCDRVGEGGEGAPHLLCTQPHNPQPSFDIVVQKNLFIAQNFIHLGVHTQLQAGKGGS